MSDEQNPTTPRENEEIIRFEPGVGFIENRDVHLASQGGGVIEILGPADEVVIHDTIDVEGRVFPVFWSSTAPGHMQMTDEVHDAFDAWVGGLAERKEDE